MSKIKDLLHRSKTELEGDAPEGYESEVMLIRDKETGEARRLKVDDSGGVENAPDA